MALAPPAIGSPLHHATVTGLPQHIWVHLKMKETDGWLAFLPFVGKESRCLGEGLSSLSKQILLLRNFFHLQCMPFGVSFGGRFMVCYFSSCLSVWFLTELNHYIRLWVLSASWSIFCPCSDIDHPYWSHAPSCPWWFSLLFEIHIVVMHKTRLLMYVMVVSFFLHFQFWVLIFH